MKLLKEFDIVLTSEHSNREIIVHGGLGAWVGGNLIPHCRYYEKP